MKTTRHSGEVREGEGRFVAVVAFRVLVEWLWSNEVSPQCLEYRGLAGCLWSNEVSPQCLEYRGLATLGPGHPKAQLADLFLRGPSA